MQLPAFDPDLHQRVAGETGFPAPVDGLTHYCGTGRNPLGEKVNTPKCGAGTGARLSLTWQLVNCPNCRD
jgi:hypothetical protein